MGFFDQMGGGGMGGGAPANPSAFATPGMNPQALAMLMALQQHAGGGMGGGAPGSPGMMPAGPPGMPPPPGASNNAPQPGAIPGQGPQPPQNNILQLLAQLRPEQLRGLLGQGGAGLGGGGPMGGGGWPMPNGTSGL